jgi:phage baseplate assembly protein W
MKADDYYGRGMSFPAALGPSGGLAESTGLQKVEESIRIILRTQYGERVMRPTFGCNLKSLVFAPNDSATANLARYYVQQGLQQWEPRIDVLEVIVENADLDGASGLLINIHYRLRATQDVQSLIYPFYLEQP